MNEQTPAFRVGGFYREQSGALVRLDVLIAPPPAVSHCFAGTVPVLISKKGHDGAFFESGWRRLSDGRYQYEMDNDASLYHLIPGELNAQGEPIAPTFYCAAETLKISPPRQLTVRAEAQDQANKLYRERLEQMYSVKVAPAAEPKRPRLTWADSKAADRFPGYSVCSDTATPDHAYSHPLTRVADAGAQTPPVCGSAWLVVR